MRLSPNSVPENTKNNELIKTISPWRKGNPLLAERLNQYTEGFNRTIQKTRPPLSSVVNQQSRLIFRRMRFIGTHEADHIICQGVDEVSVTEGNIRVAKPFLLRRTPFDNDSRVITGVGKITYVYSSNFERVATNTSNETEDQVIVPAYSTDDIIIAVHGIDNETGVVIDDVDIGWLDINDDGRAWAKKAT